MQEALIAAAAQWPADGVPDNPRGWLYHVALRRLTDQVRSEQARRRREDAVATERAAEQPFAPPADAEIAGGARRHARPAVHVLPSRAHAAVGDRAHAARGGRPHDRRDRQRVPGPRGDHGPADQPRQGEHQGLRRRVRHADRRRARRAAERRAARALPHLQRGLRQQQRRGAPARRPVRRGDPARARPARAASGRRGGGRSAGADAADRCAPRGADRDRAAS